MPKHEPFSPKAISIRQKSKGLQKLKWWCQMCQKQCRDDNGFKCHIMSESHQRQMALYTDNPNRYNDSFSQDFLHEFMRLLKVRYGTRRVKANTVYQEYISDKTHLHMNSTQFTSLTGFIKHLGRESLVEVDETEKGIFIKYIDRDPLALARQETIRQQEEHEKSEEERERLKLMKQIEKGHSENPAPEPKEIVELNRTDGDAKITVSLSLKKPVQPSATAALQPGTVVMPSLVPNGSAEEANGGSSRKRKLEETITTATITPQPPKKLSALEEIKLEQESQREKQNRKDYWLAENIVVKVVNKTLADGKYYKQKGRVMLVADKYVGQLEMLDSGDIIRVDQNHCETVIPAIGGAVKLVNGGYRGEVAKLLSLDIDKFQAKLQITQGPYNEKVLDAVPYEDFSKLYVAS